MNGRILVTPRSVTAGDHPVCEKLHSAGFTVVTSAPGRQPTGDELLTLLPGCIGYLAGTEKVTARILEAARGLRVISRNGVGVDNIDLVAAHRLGITVCNAAGANARGVAELTLAHILALARWIPFSDRSLKAGGWARRKGCELCGRTLGLVGCGHIGRLVARFALGLDMRVLAHDVKPDPTFAPSPEFRYVPLDELLARADFISLHCPALPGGRPLIDAAALAKMKRGVFLINTARADLIDAVALAGALRDGQVAGIAADVFAQEPPTGDPLVADDRVIASPHIGGFTGESIDRAVFVAAENLLAALREDSDMS